MRLSSALLTAAALLSAMPLPAQRPEARAVWACVFDSFDTAEDVRAMVRGAQEMGCNVIFFQVRFRGDAMYWPNRESRDHPNPEPRRAPAREYDPLAVCLEEAHGRGMRVEAYVDYGLVASHIDPPEDPNHILLAHPEWVMHRLGRDGQPHEWNDEDEGYWMDPGVAEFNEHTYQVVMDIVANYAVDGLHFDRIRYPNELGHPAPSRFGYNPLAVARFNQETGRTGLPEPGDSAWLQWRKDQITDFLARVTDDACALRPGLTISATPVTFDGVEGSRDSCLQDWTRWVEQGIVDVIVPQIYSRRTQGRWNAVVDLSSEYLATLDELNARRGPLGPAQMWIGLRAWSEEGPYSGSEVEEKVEALEALARPPDGFALFRYETAMDLGILPTLARTVWRTPAPFPR